MPVIIYEPIRKNLTIHALITTKKALISAKETRISKAPLCRRCFCFVSFLSRDFISVFFSGLLFPDFCKFLELLAMLFPARPYVEGYRDNEYDTLYNILIRNIYRHQVHAVCERHDYECTDNGVCNLADAARYRSAADI